MPASSTTSTSTDTAPVTPAPPPQTFDQTVEEFCRTLSASDSRVELIAGFYADERANKRFKDSAAAYEQRFASFQTRPA